LHLDIFNFVLFLFLKHRIFLPFEHFRVYWSRVLDFYLLVTVQFQKILQEE
jgi:hypothetical protein